MKKCKQPKEIVLLNSRDWLNDDIYRYSDYLEFCEMNDIEPAPEGSDGFVDWKIEECRMNFEDDLVDIKCCKKYKDATFLVTGSLGLWNGHHDIVPFKVTGLYEAIIKCYDNCDDVKVVLDVKNGIINVYAYHHDGTNCFEINLFRDYCVEAYERTYDDWDGRTLDDLIIKYGWFMKIRNPYNISA